MTKKKPTYSPISSEAVFQIASTFKKASYVAAYLTIARHADMHPHGQFGANRVSGAGANKVAKVAKVGELAAKSILTDLANKGFLQQAPAGLGIRGRTAYWIIPEAQALDTNFPHQLIDEFTQGKSSGIPLRRIFDDGEASPEIKLAALVMLVSLYREHSLSRHGGIHAGVFYREFEEAAVQDADGLYRWECVPSKSSMSTWSFTREVLEQLGHDLTGMANGDERLHKLTSSLFWPASTLLKKHGFMFEVVMLHIKEKPVMVIRFNDYHTSEQLPELGLLNAPEAEGFGFYINPDDPNQIDRGAAESFWIKCFEDPFMKMEGLRVYEVRFQQWLRFRCADPETAQGLQTFESNGRHWRELVLELARESVE